MYIVGRNVMGRKIKKQIDKNMERVTLKQTRNNMLEAAMIMGNKGEILKRNFWAGIWRGIGSGIGFTIITGLVIFTLQKIVSFNIPVLGDFIADIVEIVKLKI